MRSLGLRAIASIAVVVVVLTYAAFALSGTPGTVVLKDPPTHFSVNGRTFAITYIAATNSERESGLMNKKVTNTTTMLFVFPSYGVYSFWMSGMNASLDVIWLNVTGATGMVTYVQVDAPPCNSVISCPVYQPSADANWVIEAKAGFSSGNGIVIGSEIRFD